MLPLEAKTAKSWLASGTKSANHQRVQEAKAKSHYCRKSIEMIN